MQPGRYWLRAEIDPDDWVRESNEVNAAAVRGVARSTIPGYRAKPVNAGIVSATGPTTIPLSTDLVRNGARDARVFRIIEPPRHGTLNVAERPDVLRHIGRLHARPRAGSAPTGSPTRSTTLVEHLPALPAPRAP